ncbi:MAG TPA: IS3 family transposase [Candidatus Scybalomonas excrementigallinarum]|nr:IS3 family transposase [Candidatus Scybalomonas excrementigallinarum]
MSYDNAVVEATYRIIKTDFINQRTFFSLEQLEIELVEYINWFNHHRIHSSLNYLSPREFEKNILKKVV